MIFQAEGIRDPGFHAPQKRGFMSNKESSLVPQSHWRESPPPPFLFHHHALTVTLTSRQVDCDMNRPKGRTTKLKKKKGTATMPTSSAGGLKATNPVPALAVASSPSFTCEYDAGTYPVMAVDHSSLLLSHRRKFMTSAIM